MEKLTDKFIQKLRKESDLNVFSVLFESCCSHLLSYVLKISKNVSLTEDTLQDFFLYIYEHKENLRDLETIAPYLFTSYKRFLLNVMQKNEKLKHTVFSKQTILDIQFSEEELITNQGTERFKHIQTIK